MKFLRSFLRRHLAGKPVVALPNVGCFLRLKNLQFFKSGKIGSCLVCWGSYWQIRVSRFIITFVFEGDIVQLFCSPEKKVWLSP